MGIFSKNIGIDIGTSTVRIYLQGAGIVLEESAVAVADKISNKIIACGNEAENLLRKNPDGLLVVRPIKDGVVADFDVACIMLSSFLNKSRSKGLLKPQVYAAVIGDITEVEKRAYEEALIKSGAKSVRLFEKVKLSAIGAGISVNTSEGNMIVDIGAGTTEIAITGPGGIISSKGVRIGGDCFDKSIIAYVKKHHKMNIGNKMAERAKIAVGNVFDGVSDTEFVVNGRNVSDGLPGEIAITAEEIRHALKDDVELIIESIGEVFEQTPPELAADIRKNGIVFAGGSARLKGMKELVKEELGISVRLADDPLRCTVNGFGRELA